ncbi:MAG: SEC-C metal-binding domain-containing protein [candidate division WOR-3 bacterium]
MTITDIAEKESEERKREKRLVHLANSLSREFTESLRIKAKSEKEFTAYLVKSYLDYLFFDRHKEISELNEEHIRRFLLEFAPRNLSYDKETGKEIPTILKKLLNFLGESGYVKNSLRLINFVDENTKQFNKIIQEKKKTTSKEQKTAKNILPVKEAPKVGRNNPCPCGSGKKYKKCCGRSKV